MADETVQIHGAPQQEWRAGRLEAQRPVLTAIVLLAGQHGFRETGEFYKRIGGGVPVFRLLRSDSHEDEIWVIHPLGKPGEVEGTPQFPRLLFVPNQLRVTEHRNIT